MSDTRNWLLFGKLQVNFQQMRITMALMFMLEMMTRMKEGMLELMMTNIRLFEIFSTTRKNVEVESSARKSVMILGQGHGLAKTHRQSFNRLRRSPSKEQDKERQIFEHIFLS